MAKLDALISERDSLKKRLEKAERSLASAPAKGEMGSRAVRVDGVAVLAERVEATSVDALRYHGDAAKKHLPSGVAVLAAEIDGRPQFIAIVSDDIIDRGVHAGNILKRVASVTGGSGGGRPDTAQGGGKDPAKIEEALAIVPEAVREMLGGGK
jgi:alanyl-tRNA synthetase